MKKITLIAAALFLLTVIVPVRSIAQYSKSDVSFNPQTLYASAVIIASEESDRSELEKFRLISAKAFDNFAKRFKGAKDISVLQSGHNTFISFSESGMRTRAAYSSKGKWLHTITYLPAEKLPENVRYIVGRSFNDYTILRAIKVEVGIDSAYLVDIQRCKDFKTIRVANGEWDVYQEFEMQ